MAQRRSDRPDPSSELGSESAETWSDVLGAVLVGGESRRMGTDKARLPFRGRPLALHVAGVLERVLPEVVLVGRASPDERFPGLQAVADRFPGAGPLAGLHAALCHAERAHAARVDSARVGAKDRGDLEARAVFLAACDLPGLSPELVRHLLVKAGDHRLSPSPRAWVPRFEDRRQPLAALYSPGCRSAVETLLERGERTVHRFLDRISVAVVPVTPELPFYRPGLLDNVNRPRDLQRFEARWSR